MAGERNKTEKTQTNNLYDMSVFNSVVLAGGKNLPSATMLVEKMKRADPESLFEDVQVISENNGRLYLRFDSIGQARLFLAAITTEGTGTELFSVGLPAYIREQALIEDHRIDGDQFTYQEKVENGQLSAIFSIRGVYSDSDKARTKRFDKLIKDVVEEYIPHLKDQVKDFSFSQGNNFKDDP